MRVGFLPALFWRLAAMVSVTVSGIVSLRLYSNYVAQEAFGVVCVALQLLAYLPLLDGGFRMAVNRLILGGPPGGEKEALLRFGQTIYFYLGVVATVVATALMTSYWYYLGSTTQGFPFFFFLGIVAVLSVLSSAQASLLVGLNAQQQSFQITALAAWVNFIVLWLALRSGVGLWAFPMATLSMALATYPTALLLIRMREPSFQAFRIRMDQEFWKYFNQLKIDALACFRSQVSIVILFSIDLLIVKILCGSEAAAVYFVLIRLFGVVRSSLQAMSEVAWPYIAQKNEDVRNITQQLLRINSWIYGGTMGAILPLLLPFIAWHMDRSWAADPIVFYLLVGRFLITGLSSPAAYALLGLGEFRVVAKFIERELIAAVVLSVLFGALWGMTGVAAGFLAATAFGTLLPIFQAYARSSKELLWVTLFQVWWRAAVGCAIGFLAAHLLRPLSHHGLQMVGAGVVSVFAAVALGLGLSYIRVKRSTSSGLLRVTFQDIVKRI